MRRIGIALAALISASALSGCGSSSSGGDDADAGSFDKAQAQAIAQAAVLTLDDLPAGWTSAPADADDEDDAALQKQLADCLGVPNSLFDDSGPDKVNAESPDFESPNDGQSGGVSESVDIETADRVKDALAAVNSAKAPDCLETVFSTFLTKKFSEDPQTAGAKLGTVTATRLDIPAYGDESTGFGVIVPFSIAGQNAEVYIDQLFVRVGNGVAQLQFENTGAAFDTATAASITSKAVDKLKAAAA